MQDNNTEAARLLANMFDVESRFVKGDSDDIELLATAFRPDVVVHEPESLPYAGEWAGLDGVARLFRAMSETWAGMQVENMVAASHGDVVLMSCDLTLVSRATGRRISQPFAERLVFQDGRLRDGVPFYFDTAAIAAALR